MFEQTKENTIEINSDQFFKNIIAIILTALIIFKKIPGIGATTKEIETIIRNSIIVEVNVPVIIGKCKKYNTTRKTIIMGVYEGKTEEQIMDYLLSPVSPKKFLVTPESFKRVKAVIEESEDFDLYKDFFLLFDECERTIQDVSYRSDIILPMLDFFKFKNKAFISATPIIPSDPRFISEGFKALYIEPSYVYKEDILLLSTNNVLFTLKKFLEQNNREQYFIFLKSTETIAQFINEVDIKNECAIFCAKESMQILKANGFTNVSTSLGVFKKYNFFTSRFFSAVDIEYDTYKGDPTIIMITDLVSAGHSMIDPLSESIQITGRFRKPEEGLIKREVIHISNFDPILTSMSRDKTIEYVNERYIAYEYVSKFLMSATDKGTVDALREMLDRSEYSRFNNPDGTRNYFMQDNIIHNEQVKGFYQSNDNLKSAYKNSEYFTLTEEIEQYTFTDKDRKNTGLSASLKSVYEIIIPILHEIHAPDYNMFQKYFQYEFITMEYPKVVAAYHQLGYDKIKELGFNQKLVRDAIKNKTRNTAIFGLLDFIEDNFRVGEELSSSTVIRRLKRGIRIHNLINLIPNIQLLRKYCRLSNRITLHRDKQGREIKGYRILEVYNKRSK